MEWLLTYFDSANPYCRAGAIMMVISILIVHLIDYLFTRYYSEKCNYNCDECRDWSCQWKECDRKWKKKLCDEEKEN